MNAKQRRIVKRSLARLAKYAGNNVRFSKHVVPKAKLINRAERQFKQMLKTLEG